MTKNKAIEAVKKMPENFDIDQLIEQLIFIENVEEGLDDIPNGRLLSHEEVIRQAAC
jgi:predicted transcriptional regulator